MFPFPARVATGADRLDADALATSPSALFGRLISFGSPPAGSDREGEPCGEEALPRFDLPSADPGRSGPAPTPAPAAIAAAMDARSAPPGSAANGDTTPWTGGVIARPPTFGMNHWGLYAGEGADAAAGSGAAGTPAPVPAAAA